MKTHYQAVAHEAQRACVRACVCVRARACMSYAFYLMFPNSEKCVSLFSGGRTLVVKRSKILNYQINNRKKTLSISRMISVH